MGAYPWLKAFHVVFMVTWFAGLFYLPRLFVYHATTEDELGLRRFALMERRLFILMTIGFALTLVFGLGMWLLNPGLLDALWFRIKLVAVAFLIGYHAYCWRLMRDLAGGVSRKSPLWFRGFNEIPTLALLLIVLLAILKPN